MKIVPTSIEEQINRVDRQRSLYIGISAAVVALWSVFRLIWALYIGMTFGWFLGSMVFQLCCGVSSVPSRRSQPPGS